MPRRLLLPLAACLLLLGVEAPGAMGRGDALVVRAGAPVRLAVSGPATLTDVRVGACRRGGRVRLRLDGRLVARLPVARRARVRPLRVAVPGGRHVLAAAVTGCRGRVRVDRLRREVVALAPVPAPVAPPAPATAPPPVVAPVPAPVATPVPTAVPAAPAVPLGTALAWPKARDDAAYAGALLGTFASVTPENELKMERLQPRPGVFDFATADAVVDWALTHDLPVRGHTLVWGEQLPWWVTRYAAAFTPEQLRGILRDHVGTVMGHFAGRIHEWDVVNEAIADDGSWRRSPWLDVLGPGYVEDAFRAAREADPDATLLYNEIAAEAPGRKQDAEVAMLRDLLARGVPVDGVGLQLHTTTTGAPSRTTLEATIRRFAALGLQVQVTEADVDAAGSPAALRGTRQAAVFADAAAACRAVPACTRFTVWGVDDGDSWKGAGADALLLDAALAPKPALAAVRAALGS